MKKFSEFIAERSSSKDYKGLDSNMKADKILTDDEYFDKVYIFNKDTYEKAEKKMVAFVANVNVWKIDYNPKEFTIKIRYEK